MNRWERTAGSAQVDDRVEAEKESTRFNMVIIFKCTEISSHYVV